MPRYIDADELKQKVEHELDMQDLYLPIHFFDVVDEMPTADVAEVKRGRWIVDREFGNDVMSGEQMVICSECGKGIFWGRQNYCPNCGAKMEEVEE